MSEEAHELSEKAKVNAANKKYNYYLGAGGYSKVVRKWQKTEQELMDRDISW